MMTLKKIWSFLRNYWYIPLILAGIVVTWVVMRKKNDRLVKMLKIAEESHKKEVDAINEAHRREQEERQRIEEEYRKRLIEIEAEYAEKKKDLEEREKRLIKKYTKMYYNNPEELKSILEKTFGIKYHKED
tara:strand:+ start:1877 stop:2269 length:393 start_codon:yes stop_codon:yes gene_type:complete